MAKVLILYSSFDGHTARIAARIGTTLAARGQSVTQRSVDSAEAGGDIARHDAVIVGGAVRYGRYSRGLVALVHAHCGALASRRNAFFSVSMSARRRLGNQALLNRYVDDFRAATGWMPMQTAHFGGALLYRQYNPFLRLVMRMISWKTGGDTNTSRNHEYTDWEGVDRFAVRFASSLQAARAA